MQSYKLSKNNYQSILVETVYQSFVTIVSDSQILAKILYLIVINVFLIVLLVGIHIVKNIYTKHK